MQGFLWKSAFKAFILIKIILILINTLEERRYQSSTEEHTLQLLNYLSTS